MALLHSLILFCSVVISSDQYKYNCKSSFTSKSPKNYSIPVEVFLQFATTVTSDDPRYDELRRHTTEGGFISNAAFIVRPKTTKDVINLLQETIKYNIRPTVRSGGHCGEDFWAENPGGVLFDMSAMTKIYGDPNGVIWAEAGVRTGQLYEILWKEYGLTAPTTSCGSVGIGGSILGGAFGFLARKFGLSIDYVDQLEIVHVKSDRTVESVIVGRNSTNKSDKDLYWGLLGGGAQNFGIVTRFGFKNLPPSPLIVYVYSAEWSLGNTMNETQFFVTMDRFGAFFKANSGPHSKFCDLAYVGLNLVRRSNSSTLSISILLIEGKHELVESFIDFLGLANESFSCQKMSYYQFSVISLGISDERDDWYIHNSAYLVGGFTNHHLKALWKSLTSPQYSHVLASSVAFRGYGCAISRKSESDTAYAHRNAKIKMQFLTSWSKPEQRPENEGWLNDLYLDMFGPDGPIPNNVTDGCYVNYPNRNLINWQQLYYKGNYGRLKQVKKIWDPLNVFRYRQSVELP